MKRWSYIHDKLKLMSIKERKDIFKDFCVAHPHWRQPLLIAISEVVIRLKRQIDVSEELGIRKQFLNRGVRYYREFVVKKRYFKGRTV